MGQGGAGTSKCRNVDPTNSTKLVICTVVGVCRDGCRAVPEAAVVQDRLHHNMYGKKSMTT